MATKLTTEYSSLTNGFKTGQRYGQGRRAGKGEGHLRTPVGCLLTHTHTNTSPCAP